MKKLYELLVDIVVGGVLEALVFLIHYSNYIAAEVPMEPKDVFTSLFIWSLIVLAFTSWFAETYEKQLKKRGSGVKAKPEAKPAAKQEAKPEEKK